MSKEDELIETRTQGYSKGLEQGKILGLIEAVNILNVEIKQRMESTPSPDEGGEPSG